MNHLKKPLITAAMLAAMSSVLAAQTAPSPAKPSSVPGSSVSATRANKTASTAACMAAAVELESSRTLIDALGTENAALGERLATEKRAVELLTELGVTRRSEAEALRTAVTAKDETIAAKDSVIAAQQRLVDGLKKKKPSPWRRIGDVLIGAAAIAILR